MVEKQNMNFREFVENNFVYRIDKDRIGDFSKGLKTYYRSPIGAVAVRLMMKLIFFLTGIKKLACLQGN
jgi:hypothetical protein